MSDTIIILVNYNNHYDTLKCLRSIAEADYDNSVIVVDNNSTVPGLDEIKTQFPDTILIKNSENIGFGKANNVGIKWALENTKCEYIFILNNDTIINRFTIPTLESALQRNKSAGIAAPKIVMMHNPDILWYGGGEIDWRFGRGTAPGMSGPANAPLASKSRHVTFASGCAMLIRREVFKSIGGFDPRYFMYLEDLEFCIRATKNNFKIFYESASILLHKCQGSVRNKEKVFIKAWSTKNPNLPFYVYHGIHNMLLSINTHACGINKLKFLFYFPLLVSMKSITFLMHGRFDAFMAILRAYKDFFVSKNELFEDPISRIFNSK